MKRLAWLLAGCLSLQPAILFAAKPKTEDPLKEQKVQLKGANNESFDLILDDDLEGALRIIEGVFAALSEDQLKALESNSDYHALLLNKGSILLKQQRYDEAQPLYESTCKLLKGAKLKDCKDTLKSITDLQNTKIEFFVANPGPRTNIYLDNTKSEFCFVSEDPRTDGDPLNCKKKKKIKSRSKPYKGSIRRAGFQETSFTVTIVVNQTHKFPEDGQPLTLRDAPAPVEIALSPANATLLVDGQPSAAKLVVNPGEHTLSASAEGYAEKPISFTSKEGAIFVGGNRLKPEEALSVRLDPLVFFEFKTPNTKLYQNDKEISLLAGNSLAISEGAAPASFTARADGFKPREVTIPGPVTAGMKVVVESLTSNGAFLSLTGAPAGAELFVDGTKITSPMQEFLLTNAESYKITVTKPNYIPFETSYALKPNTPVEVVIEDMNKKTNPLLIPSFAVGGVGLVGASVFGVLALKERDILEGKDGEPGLAQQECVLSNKPEETELSASDLSESPQCVGNTNQLAFHNSFNKRRNLARASDGALVLGVIGVGVGAFAIITQKNRTSKGKIQETKVSVGPSNVSLSATF